jgi:hypothetical protein
MVEVMRDLRKLSQKLASAFKWAYAYLREHRVFTRVVIGSVIIEVMLGWMYLPGHVKSIFAADDSIDATVNATAGSHSIMSPAMVFVSDQKGYMFYRDSAGSCVYSETTNAGAAWAGAVPVNSDANCLHIAVWYDQWTPGDNMGTNIHIVTVESTGTATSGFHDSWYSKLDTSNDSLSTIANITNQTQTPSLTVTQNFPSITKATDGDLYAGVIDTTDAYVFRCTATCTTGANWAETTSDPFTAPSGLGNDTLTLEPMASGNIMAIRLDVSTNVIASAIYTDNNAPSTWSAWTTIQSAEQIAASAQYYAVGAAVNKVTNDVYLTYADLETGGTLGGSNDDIKTALFSGGIWTQMTDVLTNTTRGVSGATIALDQSSGDVYVVYTGQTTAGTASTGNVYWKKSTDKMSTWSGETGPINASAGDMSGVFVNYMSADRLYATWQDANGGNKIVGTTVADLSITYEQAAYRLFNNSDSAGGSWWNTSWLHRRQIKFNNTASTSNLANFPVRVSLSAANIDYSKTQNSGQDIRFIDADNSTVLKYEIEKWDEAGTSEVWVKVPQLDAGSATDHIWMYYDNGVASDAQDKNNVWDTNVKAVYHMKEDPAPKTSPNGCDGGTKEICDSSSNNNKGDTNGTMVLGNQVPGQINGSIDFDGTNDSVDVPDSASLDITGSVTVSAWVYADGLGGTYHTIAIKEDASAVSNYSLALDNGSLLDFAFAVGGNYHEILSNAALSTGQWYFVAATYNSSEVRLYINGALDSVTPETGTMAVNNEDLLIGDSRVGGNEPWNGKLDEIRISNSARTGDWIKAEYLTGTNAMNTFGPESGIFTAMSPLAAQDTAAARLPSGQPFRLRLLLKVASDDAQAGLTSFKLQYARKAGTCDTGFSGETYADVGTNGLTFFDNPTPADGDSALAVSGSDPTHSSDPIVNQTYEESNNFSNPSRIAAGSDGLWDFALIDTSHSSGEPYCFRVVKSDGSVINTYSVIPELTLPDLNNAMRHGNFFSGQTEENDAW